MRLLIHALQEKTSLKRERRGKRFGPLQAITPLEALLQLVKPRARGAPPARAGDPEMLVRPAERAASVKIKWKIKCS